VGGRGAGVTPQGGRTTRGKGKERDAINARKGSGDELRRDVGGEGVHTTQGKGPQTKENPRCHVSPSRRA
jgi:hypothetical protein